MTRAQASAANFRQATKSISETYDYRYLADSAEHDDGPELG